MEIVCYEPSMAQELAALYNRAVRAVPHCYPVTAERFAAEAALVRPGRAIVSGDALHVATERGRILGWAHTGVGRPFSDDGPDSGVIRFLWYEPGSRSVGQALLEEAERRLRRAGVDAVHAFPQHCTYPFYYLEPAYLSDRMGHVCALLGFNGYRCEGGEVFLAWPDYGPAEPGKPPVEGEVVVTHGSGGPRPSVLVKLRRGGEVLGQCSCVSMGEFHETAEARDWFFTDGLWVKESDQGRGLGRYLLQRALAEGRALGYRHASISTAWDNYRAFVFYSNYGYHVADWTHGWGRRLTT